MKIFQKYIVIILNLLKDNLMDLSVMVGILSISIGAFLTSIVIGFYVTGLILILLAVMLFRFGGE